MTDSAKDKVDALGGNGGGTDQQKPGTKGEGNDRERVTKPADPGAQQAVEDKSKKLVVDPPVEDIDGEGDAANTAKDIPVVHAKDEIEELEDLPEGAVFQLPGGQVASPADIEKMANSDETALVGSIPVGGIGFGNPLHAVTGGKGGTYVIQEDGKAGPAYEPVEVDGKTKFRRVK